MSIGYGTAAEPAYICSQCWDELADGVNPMDLPVSLRDRVPCAVCDFVTDSGIVGTVTLAAKWRQRVADARSAIV